jgi:hypothetical protein
MNTKIAFELGDFFNFSFISLFFKNIHIFFIYLFFLFLFFFNSLCLSNAFSAYSWLVHCLSLLISLKTFCLFLGYVLFSTCLSAFPSSFNFFPFHLLSPFHSKYH